MTSDDTLKQQEREPQLLTAKDAARSLAISPRTVWTLTNTGELPCVRFRRSVRYTEAAINTFILNRTHGGAN